MPEHVSGSLQAYLASLQRRAAAGELTMTDDERAALEAAEAARARVSAEVIRDNRLAALQKKLPDHFRWAREYWAEDWTQIRMAMRRALEAEPAAWVLMGSTPGNAKTTALVSEARRAIIAGRSVLYVAAPDWRDIVLSNNLEAYRTCDLLLVDELHELANQPRWLVTAACGVIDRRYQRRRQLQTLGAGTMPIGELTKSLPPGIADRFDVWLGAAEESQRRKQKEA